VPIVESGKGSLQDAQQFHSNLASMQNPTLPSSNQQQKPTPTPTQPHQMNVSSIVSNNMDLLNA